MRVYHFLPARYAVEDITAKSIAAGVSGSATDTVDVWAGEEVAGSLWRSPWLTLVPLQPKIRTRNGERMI